MSRAEESPEASIEEILASIRKTFADDPQAQAPEPAFANGAPAPSPSRSSFFPSFRSASEASAASPSVPLPTPPASRAAAIDADLADLLDQPASGSASVSSPVEAAREKWANLLNPGQPLAPAPAPKPVEASTAKLETPPAPHAPAQTSSRLFAPRKGGFYPPQETRNEPVLPVPSASLESAQPQPSPAPAAPAKLPLEPAPVRSGFIPAAPEPAVSAGPASPVEPIPAPTDIPAASARALDDLVAGLNNVAAAPAEPVAAPAPAVLEPPASRIVSTLSTPSPVTSAAEPTRVLSPAPAEPAAAASAPAARSFEDTVADMLRPMLEKWIDENMPRIVERALQRDASLTGRKVN